MASVTLLDRVAFYDLAIRETSDTESESLALTSQLSRAESIARSLFLPAKTVSNLKAKGEAGRRASKHTEEASKPSSSTDFSALLTFSADVAVSISDDYTLRIRWFLKAGTKCS